MTTIHHEGSLLLHANNDFVYRPRSFLWQSLQAIHYLIGSLCFTIGSFMFFSTIITRYPNLAIVAGWLFVIGSLVFMSADLQDWWDYRTGYCFNFPNRVTNSLNQYSPIGDDDNHQSHIELHVYGLACGSAFYLVGSVLFLPIFRSYFPIGEWFIVVGSMFCSFSQIWKMYRTTRNNSDNNFRLLNLLKDRSEFIMDILSIIGNACVLIGSILFLPYFNYTDSGENRAALLFFIGSICFVCASIVLLYKICKANCR